MIQVAPLLNYEQHDAEWLGPRQDSDVINASHTMVTPRSIPACMEMPWHLLIRPDLPHSKLVWLTPSRGRLKVHHHEYTVEQCARDKSEL